MNIPRLFWPAVLTSITLGAAACAASDEVDMAELEVDHALTLDFPTPHTDWAQPYALGKVRVLFFTEGMGTQPRECVELMERFDLEAQAAFWSQIVDSSRRQWHGGQTGLRRISGLLDQRWDCFVFMGLVPNALPPEQQYKLLKAVSEGAGLVLVGTDDARVLKEKNRVQPLPPLLAAEQVGEAFTVGRGRGIRLPSRPDIPYHEGWQVEDDYWHERLGRAVLWAANKEPALRLELGVSKPEFGRSESDVKLTLRLSGKPTAGPLKLDLRVRRPADEPIAWPPTDIALDTPLEFPLPVLPAGDYHADARILGSSGVEAWGTVPFRVTSPRTVAEISLAKEWGEVGEHIAGAVALAGEALPGETVRVRLLDRRRRELARSDLAPGAELRFDFAVEPWMPMLVTVEAQVRQGDQEAARASRYFHVTKRNRGRFNFLMWDFPTGTLGPYAEESLARHSVTLQLAHDPAPPAYVAAMDIAYVPYTTRIMTPKTPEGIMAPFCWNDEEAVRKCVTGLAEAYVPSRQHGVFAYSLGDENDTLGCCLSPHCARAYREYLKETYGSLDALNGSWGTRFKEWDAVGLSQEGDNEEAASLAQGNYPRWFDRQAFQSYNYVMYCRKYAAAYAAIDPQAKTGFEGAGGFARGDDLDLIVRSLDFWSPYPGTADEVLRSIAPRELPRANWMGYTKDADSLLGQYWRMVTRGMDAVWWWRWDCIGQFHGWLAPDLRPYPAVREILDDTQVVRDGLGDLLLRSQMRDDQVAVLYSYPSTFACRVADGPGYGQYEEAHIRLQEALRECRLQFRYVTDRALGKGEFDPARYKILILCRAEALGDQEADVIRRFAAGGGTVLADVRPGIYDDHCKPRAQGALDDLFGVSRQGPGAAAMGKAVMSEGAVSVFGEGKVAADPAVKVAASSARALAATDGAPAVIVHPVGKGKAVLLNFSAAGYPRLSAAETPETAAELMGSLLAQAGVTPVLRVLDSEGHRVRNLEVIRWEDGGLELVGLFRRGGQAQEATVELGSSLGSRHVYDLRNRKSLGRVERFPVTILPNRASFFVLAGSAVPPAKLTLSQTAAQRGMVVKASLSVPGAEGLHALRIRARAGEQKLDWLDQNVIVGAEPVEISLPIAYNDPVGEYEIRAIDLFTNEAASARLKVQ